MFALVGEGDMAPSAADIAARAGVGLRTVFRHFEDMDSLYSEMTSRIESELMPIVVQPFEASDWRGKLAELMERRARVFERMMPFRVAGAARRFQSPYLMADYRRTLAFEQAAVRAVLPKTVLADAVLSAAIDVALSFETWRRLRQGQGHSPKKALEVVQLMIDRLTQAT
ncbi:MAG: TetR family transcriptional regulator [Alphaproteobacteria bacterium]|nr:TetR family transcriptional regulator [Alphaproteobacteria bacterium]